MKIVIAIVSMILFSVTFGLQQNKFDESKEKASFKKYFIKAFKLRFKNDNSTTKIVIQKTRRVLRSGTKSEEELSEDLFRRYKHLSKSEKFIKVKGKNGTTNEKLELVADEIWDRLGAEVVEKTLVTIGVRGGSIAGGFLGSALGMAIGIAIPPLQLTLTIGGVLIGKQLGRAIGYIAGKASADYVNSLISHNVIGKYFLQPLYSLIKSIMKTFSTSPKLTCRSDICSKVTQKRNVNVLLVTD